MPLFLRALFANPVSRDILIIDVVAITSIFVMAWGNTLETKETFVATMLLFGLGFIGNLLVLLVGIWTCNFYRQAKDHILQYQKVDERFAKLMSDAPCKRTGLNLAKKDLLTFKKIA